MRVMVLIAALALLGQPVLAHDPGASESSGERQLQVLKTLPTEADAYQAPAAELIAKGIPERYGKEEWAAVVLAHEFHQHVGILTVIGAKMAVHARELLDAPSRAVRVVTETGPEPPYSCIVDGIQAAIGSTYAQQLIEAPPVETPRSAASFEYEGRKVRLSLRRTYQKQIDDRIRAAIQKYGNLTPEYFKDIEAYSYSVWADFDRREIFDETFITSGAEDK